MALSIYLSLQHAISMWYFVFIWFECLCCRACFVCLFVLVDFQPNVLFLGQSFTLTVCIVYTSTKHESMFVSDLHNKLQTILNTKYIDHYMHLWHTKIFIFRYFLNFSGKVEISKKEIFFELIDWRNQQQSEIELTDVTLSLFACWLLVGLDKSASSNFCYRNIYRLEVIKNDNIGDTCIFLKNIFWKVVYVLCRAFKSYWADMD